MAFVIKSGSNVLVWPRKMFCTFVQSISHCNTLRHTATHCDTLLHTATHCNTLLHTFVQSISLCEVPTVLKIPETE